MVTKTRFMHNRLEGSTLAGTKRSSEYLTPGGDVSTGEHAYRQIRSAIVRCDYGPGRGCGSRNSRALRGQQQPGS
jgi:hypothetical protein